MFIFYHSRDDLLPTAGTHQRPLRLRSAHAWQSHAHTRNTAYSREMAAAADSDSSVKRKKWNVVVVLLFAN